MGEQAVGWRVAVHWQADKAFHPAIVESYDATTGQHCLAYSRGEQEHLHLSRQSLKWCPRPDTSKQVEPHLSLVSHEDSIRTLWTRRLIWL